MVSFFELQKQGVIKPMIKACGFKIPKNDLEILVELCKDSVFAEKVNCNRGLSNSEIANLLKFYIRGANGDFKPITVSDSEFERLETQNAMFRATSKKEYDLKQLLSSPVILRNGSGGSGIYFSESDGSYLPNYIINHLQNKVTDTNVGNIYKVALNPDANLVDKFALRNTIQEVIKAIDDGCYHDGTKLNIGCDKEVLKKLLSNDLSVVALLMGANAIYLPFAPSFGEKMILGHYVLLDKNPIIVPKDTSSLNAQVDITNLRANPDQEIEKIKSILIKR